MKKRPSSLLVAFGACALVLLVGYLDYLTGPEIGFSIFYLVPIIVASWFALDRTILAAVVSVLSAAVWLLADLYSVHQYTSAWIPYWNMFIRLVMFVAIGMLLSRVRSSHAREQALARTDALTGALNARYFAELATREISRLTRYPTPLTFGYLDVDDFKKVNDELGHLEGDELLKTLAHTVLSCIRDVDILVRLGGDEFGILLPNTNPEQARAAMTKIHTLVHQELSARWPITLSAGVVTFAVPPKSVDEMVRLADKLMYDAKRSGKNDLVFQS